MFNAQDNFYKSSKFSSVRFEQDIHMDPRKSKLEKNT